MNVELMNKVIARIEAHPESFSMVDYIKTTDCGTVACVAGHALLLSGYYVDEHGHLFNPHATFGSFFNTAADLLDLSDDEAQFLFYNFDIKNAEDLKRVVQEMQQPGWTPPDDNDDG